MGVGSVGRHDGVGRVVRDPAFLENGRSSSTAPASPRLDVSARIARAECFFGATGATLAHGGTRTCCYRPSTDSIVLPLFETFRDAESYHASGLPFALRDWRSSFWS